MQADIELRNVTAALRLRVGNLHVGAPDSAIETLVDELLADIRRRYPHLTIGTRVRSGALRYALREHHSNRRLYADVMAGV
jgi:DNA-binding transcriptional LysR family regulator